MKYIIDKNNDNTTLVSYKININGLEVHPKNRAKSIQIKAKKVVIVDSKLCSSYIKQSINNRINKVISFMLHILSDDDVSESDSGMVIDEVNRLKGIIINKYKKYMEEDEYKETLNKLIIIEEEFKKNYNKKLYSNYMSNMYYEDGYYSARGR